MRVFETESEMASITILRYDGQVSVGQYRWDHIEIWRKAKALDMGQEEA